MVKKTATIQDVANKAGVSTATVSRALSNPDVVTKETREIVLTAVRATGYRANRAARNLRTQRAGAIGVLVPNLSNPYFSPIISAIQRVFSGTDFSVLVTDTIETEQNSPDEGLLVDGRADGLLVLDSDPESVAQSVVSNAPEDASIIYVNDLCPARKFPSVSSDDAAGARLAAEHLLDLGHTRLAIVTGPSDRNVAVLRRDAFVDACKERGVEDVLVVEGDFSPASGERAAGQILTENADVTGVFCSSDMMALGLLSAAIKRGRQVPESLSVVGYDDIGVAQYFIPALTTVRQDRAQIGAIAARLLLNKLTGKHVPDAKSDQILGVELIERNSTAAPKR